MGDPKGFLTLRRATAAREPAASRVQHWNEFYQPRAASELEEQGARCMDCGVPFCQGDTGCPVRNLIPEWNDLVFHGRWHEASDVLHSTNNFPEFTGRLCPAPCESACVLGVIDQPVAIRSVEQAIVDRAFEEGWIAPRPPLRESGKRVAVVGSGPAGLAAAQQLRRAGHAVTVFERDDRVGGLLRYGIPDFKMEKSVLDRRLAQLSAEGIAFRTGVDVGRDVTIDGLRAAFDAVLLANGAQKPRDLNVPGRDLDGVHFAMDFLTQQNRRGAGDDVSAERQINAKDKRVIIIGGGDTGSDCAGTCIRQGALSVRQFELLPQPPAEASPATPWPLWPMQLRSSHAHEEGCEREWSVATTAFAGESGVLRALRTQRVVPVFQADVRTVLEAVAGSEQVIEAELVLLAMGFTGVTGEWSNAPGAVQLDARGVVASQGNYRTSVDGVFAAGDARRGASLIVWAIREGRDAAAEIDRFLARGL
jgi:glutamate synthase (NADPH/NADH) small chain